MKKNAYQSKSTKSGNKDFLHSNVETGAHNWNWQPDRNNYRMNNEEINAYKKQQLSNAKKVGGGILNTNVETGNWHGMQFIVPEKSDRIGPNDLEAQEKFFRGQLKETITGPLPGEKGQNAPVKFNDRGNWGGQYQNINKNYDNSYHFNEPIRNNNLKYAGNEQNYNESQQKGEVFNNQNNLNQKINNVQEPDFDKLMEAGPGVMKVEVTEKFINEDGVKLKLTRIKKYMENGEIKTTIYKTKA